VDSILRVTFSAFPTALTTSPSTLTATLLASHSISGLFYCRRNEWHLSQSSALTRMLRNCTSPADLRYWRAK
jgi:hypothetical protein